MVFTKIEQPDYNNWLIIGPVFAANVCPFHVHEVTVTSCCFKHCTALSSWTGCNWVRESLPLHDLLPTLLFLLFHSSAQHRYDQISLMSKCLIISDRYQDGLVSSLTYIYVYWSHLRNIFTFFDKHPTNTEKKLPAKCYVHILQWIYIWSMKYLLC